MRCQRGSTGFTLIELMIVVAIIAILAAIAIPLYSGYVARSQAVAALGEIAPGRAVYESHINNGDDEATDYDVGNLGLQQDTSRCHMAATAPANGVGEITCQIKGNSKVDGKTIKWVRNSSGSWQCQAELAAQETPRGCISNP